jgi:sensor c-di-GMP phosphodiesterase-like protein
MLLLLVFFAALIAVALSIWLGYRDAIAMAQKLNMEVLAEGVETHQQVDFLRLNQCNTLQSYLFCRPVSSGELSSSTTLLQKALSDFDGAIFGTSASRVVSH